MKPKNVATIYLTVTTSSDPISVDNNGDELVSPRAPIETYKPLLIHIIQVIIQELPQHLYFILVLCCLLI